MRRKLRSQTRVETYSRWYERRYRGKGELKAVVEFAWKFQQIAMSARWFQEAVADLISVLVIDRKRRGKSLRHIASLLNRMRIPTRRSGRWYASTVTLYTRPRPTRLIRASDAFRTLCAIYGSKRQDLSWFQRVISDGDTTSADVRLLWDMHRLTKNAFKILRQDIVSRFRRHENQVGEDTTIPRRDRLVSYVRRCSGTRELPLSTLRAALLTKGIETTESWNTWVPSPVQPGPEVSTPKGSWINRLTRRT